MIITVQLLPILEKHGSVEFDHVLERKLICITTGNVASIVFKRLLMCVMQIN